MKVQMFGAMFLCLLGMRLSGAQQKQLLNQGQIQQHSLDSTSSNGSIPSVGFPDPFSFDEGALSAARIAPTYREQVVREQEHDQPNSENSLQGSLLSQENLEPQTHSQIHDLYVKPRHESASVCRGWKLSKQALLYVTLFVLGLTHGAINKHLSGGAWNEHFWNAPWREWEIGAGANVLETFAAVLCYSCFHIKNDLSPKQQDWIARPWLMVMLGGGQMLGECMPTPDSSGWRNVAVNMWTVPTSLWYLMLGIRSIRDYYANKPLLNPADRGLYEAM